MKKNTARKTPRKINVFDVVIILLIVLLIGTLIYRIYISNDKESTQSGTKYVIYFECDNVYNSLISYLEEDEAVYLQSGELLGYFYCKDGDEKGAVYELVDDIPTYAEELDKSSEESIQIKNDDNISVDEASNITNTNYRMIKIGGNIRLSYEAVRVQKGNYFSIGNTNITEGSTVKVFTDDAEFILTVKDIVIVE